MKDRLEQARKRLAELLTEAQSTGQALSPDKNSNPAAPVVGIENPDAWERGSIAHERERIKHLERMTAKDK